jgi:predicted RNase H-like HicB family nuclease
MSERFYPAVLERDAGGVFALWFPDFPGCVAAARTQEEAMAKARAALAAGFQDLAERDQALPSPTAFDAIKLPPKCDFVAFVAVGAMPPDPSERVNVYLPKSLIARIDEAAAAMGMSRSSFFGLALTSQLAAGVLGRTATTARKTR